MTNSIRELWDMGPGDCVCIIGSNTTACHPIIGLGMMEAKRNGAKLIVIDPREIDLAREADVWLRLRPGTDTALLSAIAGEILNAGLADVQTVAAANEDFENFRKGLTGFDVETVSAISEVPVDDIRKTARCIAQSANTAFYYTMGITQHTAGTSNVLAVSNLALLTGNIGRPKTGVNPLRGQNNVQGACDMGALPNVLPGYRPVTDDSARAAFKKVWRVDLPAVPGLTIPQMQTAIEEDRLKGLFVFGENPMRSDPDITHVKHCLNHVDFLVVQDIFLTETAQLADVVLPGASFAEKDGTFTNTERRVQRVRRAVSPVGDSRPDWKILAELLERFGRPEQHADVEDVFNEMRMLTPSYRGITYERLESGGVQWPCPDEKHPGTPIMHVGQCVRGPGKFVPLTHKEPAELPDAEYPLTLTTGRVVAHYHTATMTRRCFGLAGTWPEELVEIHPSDASEYGIVDGDLIEVRSRRGVAKGRAKVTRRVRPGLVFMTFHFSESPVNILTTSAADPVAGTPQFKVCAVSIRKLTDDAHVVNSKYIEPTRLSPFILATASKCIGCRSCELACAAAHVQGGVSVGSLQGPMFPRLYLTCVEDIRVPVGCRHCEDASCIAVCPNAAIYRTKNGVQVDESRCVGCKTCLVTCPVGAMEMAQIWENGKMVMRRVVDPEVPENFKVEPALLASKCDLCRSREAGPACVEACPEKALVLINPVKIKKRRNVEAALALKASGARTGEEL